MIYIINKVLDKKQDENSDGIADQFIQQGYIIFFQVYIQERGEWN